MTKPSPSGKTAAPTACPLVSCTLAETLDKNMIPVPCVIDGLLFQGHTTMCGPPKEGKSFAALECAVAVASGELAFGTQRVHCPGKVLYLCLEDGERRVSQRVKKRLGDERPDWLASVDFVYDLPHCWTRPRVWPRWTPS